MNSFQYDETRIMKDELMVLQDRKSLDEVPTFSKRECLAIQYQADITNAASIPQVIYREIEAAFQRACDRDFSKYGGPG